MGYKQNESIFYINNKKKNMAEWKQHNSQIAMAGHIILVSNAGGT